MNVEYIENIFSIRSAYERHSYVERINDGMRLVMELMEGMKETLQ